MNQQSVSQGRRGRNGRESAESKTDVSDNNAPMTKKPTYKKPMKKGEVEDWFQRNLKVVEMKKAAEFGSKLKDQFKDALKEKKDRQQDETEQIFKHAYGITPKAAGVEAVVNV